MDIDDQNQPLDGRLVITKMVMTDFKSYAGEQTVGEFHKVRRHKLDSLSTAQPRADLMLHSWRGL